MKWLRKFLSEDISSQAQFERRIQQDFPFLFVSDRAKIVPNGRASHQIFDNAIITVEVGDIRFRFVQDRGEQRIDVAPLFEPEAWEPLDYAVEAANPGKQRYSWVSLAELAAVLKVALPSLENAFSKTEYAMTKQMLKEIHDRERRLWVADFNNRNDDA